ADSARLHRGAGGAVRLLHRRHDDAGAGAAAACATPDRRANPRRAWPASLPLRHAYAHHPRGETRGATDGYRSPRSDQPGDRAMNASVILDRRKVLAGGGALIVSFSLTSAFAQDQGAPAPPAPKPPGSLATAPYLDSWIRIDADNTITIFTGKAELRQGFKTAFQNVAAQVRALLIAEAAKRLAVAADDLRTENGGVIAQDGRRLSYGELVA